MQELFDYSTLGNTILSYLTSLANFIAGDRLFIQAASIEPAEEMG